ncbi:MAG: Cof-type HAD-IIB family hydrolase [Actinobacteria bacterium]|nr:Cof-type HAD-IIB family hydrolase [Actinomycetota bacterium]
MRFLANDGSLRDAGEVLVVSDLDFTLLRKDASLGTASVQILRGLLERGLRFSYATARSQRSAHRILGVLPLALPVVTYGGTVLADPVTGAPHDVRHLPVEALDRILRAVDRSELEPIVHTWADGGDRLRWRAGRETAGVRFFVDARAGDPRLVPMAGWAELDRPTAFYVSILGERDAVTALRDELAPELAATCRLLLSADVYTPGMHWLEIHALDGSKAHGVQRLSELVGIPYVVAFGDNIQDIPLFELADESYAVANAVPELRAIASAVIGDNDEDAVARWLALRLVD